MVLMSNGIPLPGVEVEVKDQTLYDSSYTRSDGR